MNKVSLYSEGTISDQNSALFNLREYLNGVSLARQAINHILPSVLSSANGFVVDIGGSGNLERHVPQDRLIIFDYVHRPQNTVTADATRMPFPSESISRVLCISVLEHAQEPFAILRECARILRRDGILFLSTPWLFEAHMEPQDYWRFSSWQMEKWFADTGLEIISKSAANGWWGLLAHVFQKRGYTKCTLGLAFAAVHFFRRSSTAAYTTQLNYCLRKA